MTSDSRRFDWFREARVGLFVHWGMYSVLGRGEQIMARDLMPLCEYDPIADRFKPDPDWADRLAQQAVDAGMRYIVLTTKHHDGYCMFDTVTHDFNAAKTGPGRDLVAEFVDAARRAGLRVGFYYSLMSWRWRGYWSPEKHPDDLREMVDEVHTHIRELMTNYGKIDVLWYDGDGAPGGATHGMWGGHPYDMAPVDFWRAEELDTMVRELQPEILVNNRSGLPADFGTPEQRVTAEGGGRPWETCMTLNYAPGWGYLRDSMANKSPGEVLFNLVDSVRLGGNFLFNVGPRADGSVDERESVVLDKLGAWMKLHGEAIYDTQPESIYNLALGHLQGPMFHYGMWTCRGTTGYLTLFYYPGDGVVISKIGPRITSASLLTTGEPLQIEESTNGRVKLFGLPDNPPDELAPVVKVEFESPPYAVTDLNADWLDGTFSPS
jgi:alpha-L-fucosidase